MDIPVSLQFHDEGRLAHLTLRALHRVVAHAEQCGKQVEVVATLDRTRDEVLRRIVRQWSGLFRAFLLELFGLPEDRLATHPVAFPPPRFPMRPRTTGSR